MWSTNILTYPKHLDIATLENKNDIIETVKSTNVPNKEYILKHLNGTS